jgi:uncharacterized protein YndB with AHSA1/START domain
VQFDFALEIDRPVEEVFAYISDADRLADWDPRVVRVVRETEGPLGVGTRFRETRKVFGREVDQVVEVSEYEPPNRFSLRIVSGPLPINARNLLERIDGRTRLRLFAEGELSGLARAAQPLVKRLVKRQLRQHYARIRQNLEPR